MKKFISAVLVIMLLASLSVPAYAASAKYSNTKDFIAMLDENDFTYTLNGIDEDNDEWIVVDIEDEGYEFEINCYFDEEEDVISFRLWYLMEFKDKDYFDVLKAVNELNGAYKFVTFVLDESDNTVTAKMDAVVREGCEIGEIGFDCLYYLVMISEIAYEDYLGDFDIA